MFRKLFILNAFCLVAASAALAAPAVPSAGTISDVTAGEAGLPAAGDVSSTPTPVGGPILSVDPEVRQQIRDLYLEKRAVGEEALLAIQALNVEYAESSDRTARSEIVARLADLKTGLEIRNMEILLEIAVLNEDARRIEDLELGLERARNPEAYRAHFVDPSAGQQRRLEPGLE